MNPEAVLAVGDQPCALQVGQMARDLRLICIEDVNQMADADLAFGGQQVDQSQTRLVGAGLQKHRHLRQQFVSGCFFVRVASGSRHARGIIAEEENFREGTIFALTNIVPRDYFSDCIMNSVN